MPKLAFPNIFLLLQQVPGFGGSGLIVTWFTQFNDVPRVCNQIELFCLFRMTLTDDMVPFGVALLTANSTNSSFLGEIRFAFPLGFLLAVFCFRLTLHLAR